MLKLFEIDCTLQQLGLLFDLSFAWCHRGRRLFPFRRTPTFGEGRVGGQWVSYGAGVHYDAARPYVGSPLSVPWTVGSWHSKVDTICDLHFLVPQCFCPLSSRSASCPRPRHSHIDSASSLLLPQYTPSSTSSNDSLILVHRCFRTKVIIPSYL